MSWYFENVTVSSYVIKFIRTIESCELIVYQFIISLKVNFTWQYEEVVVQVTRMYFFEKVIVGTANHVTTYNS